jgi:HAD superfamily hydrolase (TIGR01549 family)
MDYKGDIMTANHSHLGSPRLQSWNGAAILDDFDTFIFDWDGTLSTSTALVRFTKFFKLRYTLTSLKKREEEYAKVAAMKESDPAIKKIEEKGSMYSGIYDIYSIFEKPKLREGAKDMLSFLEKKRKKIALFSDGKKYRIKRETSYLSVAKRFDMILSAEEAGYYKPNPAGIILIISKLKAKKARTIYIGDMASDIMAAKFAGVSSCGVGGGLDTLPIIKSVNPDFVFPSLEHFYKALSGKRS